MHAVNRLFVMILSPMGAKLGMCDDLKSTHKAVELKTCTIVIIGNN